MNINRPSKRSPSRSTIQSKCALCLAEMTFRKEKARFQFQLRASWVTTAALRICSQMTAQRSILNFCLCQVARARSVGRSGCLHAIHYSYPSTYAYTTFNSICIYIRIFNNMCIIYSTMKY